jgi:hypothetical protein
MDDSDVKESNYWPQLNIPKLNVPSYLSERENKVFQILFNGFNAEKSINKKMNKLKQMLYDDYNDYNDYNEQTKEYTEQDDFI